MHTLFIVDPHQRNKHGDYLCWREWIEDAVFAAIECKKHIAAGRWVCPYNEEEHDPYLYDRRPVPPPPLEP